MAETIIMKGALEDHMGRILHPDTESDQVVRPNGETAEETLQRILAAFAGYLPVTGGIVNGPLGVHQSNIYISQWGCISCGTNGFVMIANNAYIHPTNNTYHFVQTHESIGARGIILQNGIPGILWFDTLHRATTKDEAFTPITKPLAVKPTVNINNLDNITENTIVDCNELSNGPGNDWYYVVTLTHSNDPQQYRTQIAFAFHSTDVKRRRLYGSVWSEWEPFLTQSNTPAQWFATWEPLPTDGKDGDVWDVYV